MHVDGTSQKCTLSHAISFTGNYCLLAQSDFSYRFNGENDNVVLEFCLHFVCSFSVIAFIDKRC